MTAENLCTFYLVCHGETNMNVSGFLQGQSDSILTEKGKEQAKTVDISLSLW